MAALVELKRKEDEEKERRGGAAPPILVRPAAVSYGLGGGSSELGLGRLFFGVNGRGGFLGLARAIFGSGFSTSQLTLLSIALGGAVLMGVLGAISFYHGAPSEDEAAPVWSVPGPAGRVGSALTRPSDEARYMPEDLIATGRIPGPAEERPRENDAPKSVPEKTVAEAPAEAPADGSEPAAAPDRAAPPQLLAGSLGFGNGSRFGGGDILRDGLNAGASADAARAGLTRPLAGEAGDLSGASRRATRASLNGLNGRQSRASRAAGQLRFANRASTLGLGSAGADAARQYSTDAFEQKSTIAGPPTGGVGLNGGDVAGPLGVGAPDVTQQPAIGPAENVTPYQEKADDAKKGIDMAMVLLALGAALMAGGLAMLIMGKQMMATPATKAQGAMLMKIGAMMLMAGIAALAAGAMMANDSKKKGKEIGQDSGQKEQGRIIQNCSDDALSQHRCTPRTVPIPESTVQQDVAAERAPLTGDGPVQ